MERGLSYYDKRLVGRPGYATMKEMEQHIKNMVPDSYHKADMKLAHNIDRLMDNLLEANRKED